MKIGVPLRLCLLALLVVSVLPLTPTNSIQADSNQKTFVRINQLGYRSTDSKIAIAFSSEPLPQPFIVVEANTQRAAFEGSVKPLAGRWGKFDFHAELDFSTLRKPGSYFLRIGDTTSPTFEIGAAAYRRLSDQLLEFMRQQRCGYNPWLDAVCHSFDGRTAFGPLPAGTYLNATGGWHDAGDLLKYLLTASNATAQLLLAYQLRTASQSPFADDVNSFGQTGANGVADVLDEARWGLDWMLKLHPAPGQLYHQVADDRDHRGWRLPQNESVDYG